MFRKTPIDALIEVMPEQARRKILAALRATGGDATAAAARLGVAKTTLWRWQNRLRAAGHPIDAELAEIRAKAGEGNPGLPAA
jgi:transposase